MPPHHTLGYARLVPHAESLTFERTGHIGIVTLPAQFAATVAAFVERADLAAVAGRRGRGKRPADMNTRRLRGIAGPVGHLEALLEPPALTAGERLRAAVVFAHPHPLLGGTMHTKGVYRATKALGGAWAAPCSGSTSVASGRATACSTTPSGELEDFRAGLDFMASRYPGVELWAAGFSFGAYVALTAGARDDRVSTLIGIAPGARTMYNFSELLASRKAEVLRSGRARRDLPARAHARRSSRSCRSRSGSSWCLARTICSTARSSGMSARAITEMFATDLEA